MNSINKILPLVLLTFLPAKYLNGQVKTLQTFKNISALEFKRISESDAMAVIIDVRSKKKFRKGHIKNSVLAEKRIILDQMCDTLDFDQPILVYCEEGTRSITACTILKEKGFLHVYNLESGLIDWEKSGFDLTKK